MNFSEAVSLNIRHDANAITSFWRLHPFMDAVPDVNAIRCSAMQSKIRLIGFASLNSAGG